MPGLTHSAARLALVFALVGGPAHTASHVAPPETFDVYAVGIRIAALTVADDGGSRSYTIRKKDFASNQWRSAITASESDAARDTAFGIPASIKNVAAWMSSLRTIHWSSQQAVGWPDANTIYVPHTTLRESVNGRTVSATHWVIAKPLLAAQPRLPNEVDGSSPRRQSPSKEQLTGTPANRSEPDVLIEERRVRRPFLLRRLHQASFGRCHLANSSCIRIC